MEKPVKSFFKVFLSIIIIVTIVVAGLTSGAMLGYFNISDGFDYDTIKMSLSSVVLAGDKDGQFTEYEHISASQNRVWTDLPNIPKHMQDALVAIEDERFYKHHGVDVKRTLGAFLGYITGNSSYGGSSITQQLIKNVSGDTSRTPTRKLIEMWRAINMEARYDKGQILELYLNTIYLGEGAYGVQAASRTYFSKDVWDLNLPESACIIGITQYPGEYDPFINPEKNKEKQEVVLRKMYALGMISQQECDDAIAHKLVFKKEKMGGNVVINSYFTDNLIEDVISALVNEKGYTRESASNLIYSGGLKIYSTVDPSVQESMEKIYENESNFPSGGRAVKPQAAMVIMDPYTGEVKGLVGGRGKKTSNRPLNYATQTVRQPGSAIKPIGVYAPALENKVITTVTSMNDAPKKYGNWTPKNSYRPDKGDLTMRRAIQYSSNTIAVGVLHKLGVTKSFDFLENNVGITSLVNSETIGGQEYTDKNYSALALGGMTHGVSVMQMTAAYTPFVNYGTYTKPYSFTKVTDRNGKELLKNKKKTNRAMSEQTAFMMNNLMTSVIKAGTATGAALKNSMPAGGKTGTSSDDFDRWFIGFTPYYVGAAWIGYSTPQSMGWMGSNPNVSLWKKVMDEIHKDLPVIQFKEATGIRKVTVCGVTGKRPGEGCPTSTEYILSGASLSGTCDGRHNTENIDNPVEEKPVEQDPEGPKPPTPTADPDEQPTDAPPIVVTPKPTPNTTPIVITPTPKPTPTGDVIIID